MQASSHSVPPQTRISAKAYVGTDLENNVVFYNGFNVRVHVGVAPGSKACAMSVLDTA